MGRGSPPFELPAWLMRLVDVEGTEVDARAVSARMARVGVTAVGYRGDESRPDAITVSGPGLDLIVDVERESADGPVAAAVGEVVDYLEHFGPLRQLHTASTDMSLVADAARELARYRHAPGGDEGPFTTRTSSSRVS